MTWKNKNNKSKAKKRRERKKKSLRIMRRYKPTEEMAKNRKYLDLVAEIREVARIFKSQLPPDSYRPAVQIGISALREEASLLQVSGVKIEWYIIADRTRIKIQEGMKRGSEMFIFLGASVYAAAIEMGAEGGEYFEFGPENTGTGIGKPGFRRIPKTS